MLERAAVTDAVGLIYETVAEPLAWNEVIPLMAREIRASASWLFKPGAAELEVIPPHGIGRDVRDAYGQRYMGLDLLRNAGIRRWHEIAGRATRECDLVGEQEWKRSALYNEFAEPNGIGYVLAAPMGMTIGQKPLPILSFFRAPGDRSFELDAVRRFDHLMPHLCRAVRLREAIGEDAVAVVPDWTASLLDQLSAAIILLDATGRIRHANLQAQAILDRRDGLRIERGSRLGTPDEAAGRRLAASVARAISRDPAGSELRVPRGKAGAATPWLVSVTPLPAAVGVMFGDAALRCCVWIANVAAVAPYGARLAALFGLTVAEQRIAAGLLADMCPREIAYAHGVSLPTVRTQIQAIFAKLGVQRQAELVRLLTKVETLPALSQ